MTAVSGGSDHISWVRTTVFTALAGLILGLVLAVGSLAGHASSTSVDASPPDDDATLQVIQGRVNNETMRDGERVREGVPGVRIVVESESGELYGEAVTGDNGAYAIEITQTGPVVIRLDTSTLPDDLSIEEEDASSTREIRARGKVTQAFNLGEDLRTTASKISQLPQTLANGLKLSMIIAVASVGLSLIFGTTGLSNFAYGEMVTFGAVMAWWINRSWGWTLVLAALVAVVLGAVAGGLFERAVFRPLRRRGTSLTSMMIVTIGIALGIRHLILFLIGGDLKQYNQYTLQLKPIKVWLVSYPPRSVWIIGLSLVVLLAVAMFLLRTRFGKAIRAVSDNPSLAASSGIDANRVILIVWILAGGLAALGGVFYGLEYGVAWDMGFGFLLLMFAAITLGGLGNPFGALVGSLVIGIFVELWTFVVPNANDLKNVGALIILIVLLLVRPQGILGNKERIG